MWKVKCIQHFGVWCRPGRVLTINNLLADSMERKGNVKKLEFLGNRSIIDRDFVENKIEYHKNKVKYYKIMLKKIT